MLISIWKRNKIFIPTSNRYEWNKGYEWNKRNNQERWKIKVKTKM